MAKKSFYTMEVVNIYTWGTEFLANEAKASKLPIKIRYAIKRGISKIEHDAKLWIEFRDNELARLRTTWFDEEHSVETEIPKYDEAGNPVLDEDGNQIMEQGRKIKDEYIEDLQAASAELQNKLNELLVERNTYDISTVNMDAFVESLEDDESVISFGDLEMMCFIDETTNLADV